MESDDDDDVDVTTAMAVATRRIREAGGDVGQLTRAILAALAVLTSDDSEAEIEEEEEEQEYVEEDDAANGDEERALVGPAYDGLSDEDVLWAKRLNKWMRCFSEASIEWALVEDGGPDGKKRHGLVVTLTADVTAWDYKGDEKVLKLSRLREAIDLVRLVALVKPVVLKPVIRILQQFGWDLAPTYSPTDEELNALARGVPVDVRFELTHNGVKTVGLKQRLANYFFHKLSGTSSSNAAFVEAWTELMTLFIEKHGVALCNRRFQEPVPLTVVIDSCETRGAGESESEEFYRHVLSFAEALHSNQQAQKTKVWALDGRHAQLHVNKIHLRLRSLFITRKIGRLATSLMTAGIPVNCTYVSIDPRLIERDSDLLQSFVNTLGTGEMHVATDTALSPTTMDVHQENETEVIRMVVNAMTSVNNTVKVDFGGLLKVCRADHNREAIWQGLFDCVLSREPLPQDISFTSDVQLMSDDVVNIRRCTSRWREANPGKQLRVRKLRLSSMGSHKDAIVALLAAFDDVEELSIDENVTFRMHPPEVLLSALRFPSLRELSFENVVVESMDVFDPLIPDERLPRKPLLEALDLINIMVRDTESLQRFITRLVPIAEAPHPLSSTLRRLTLSQKNQTFHHGPIFDKDLVTAMHKALLQNTTLEEVNFTVDGGDESSKIFEAQFKKHTGRHVRASPKVCRSAIVQARQRLFSAWFRTRTSPKRLPVLFTCSMRAS